ncbi:MAG: response regulator [Pseudohongiella sp.]|nr:response regulator [Pseudohongiella sp.]MDO9520535.1 response regulator [Pseudohongiella sp.]MDP2126457.1 response regulator [Pseudohongiella sp.]
MEKTVLIVDDSATMRQLISMTLKNAGYKVIEANDGSDALTKLNGPKINLMISDVNMPVMDGITLIKKVKELPSYRFMPIIMLTTEAGDSKKAEGKAAGAKAWIVKPFQPDVLLSAVKTLILP